MIYIANGNKKYKCTPPDEHRINIYPQRRQWVIDFTITDNITSDEMDELLSLGELNFVRVDETTKEETMLTFSDYSIINSASVKYEQDLSCTATVQLGKEIESNACKI